ncbi:hypothetical protein R1flu_005311 [Riccia fluitans]|uniref:Uncharacterized protein n=1 Tax=Riccia fluitans TaxID=41844 RepID=A0ABD1YWS7_9MARC
MAPFHSKLADEQIVGDSCALFPSFLPSVKVSLLRSSNPCRAGVLQRTHSLTRKLLNWLMERPCTDPDLQPRVYQFCALYAG